MTWKFSEIVSEIGLVLETIFQNEHFLSSKKPGNRNKFAFDFFFSSFLWNLSPISIALKIRIRQDLSYIL